MEKQPVDDLFARKLREAEVPVSPDVLMQLQRRLNTKPLETRRSVTVWWYVAAACVLLTGAFLFSEQKTEKEQLAISTVGKRKQSHEPLPGHIETTQEPIQLANNQLVLTKPVKRNISADETHHKAAEELTIQVDKKREGRLLSNVQTQKLYGSFIGIVAPLKVLTALEPALQVAATKQSLPGVSSVQLAIVGTADYRPVAQKKQATERTIVMNIDDPMPISDANAQPLEERQRNTSVTNLLDKLKQLKNGEVLARAGQPVATEQNSSKKRLSRVFNEVKESLKNETTLE